MEKIGRDIILLGWISFFTDMSSETIMPVLPFFIVELGGINVIGKGVALGLIMGFGTMMASLTNVASGIASDKLGKRKIFIFSGYTLSSISKLFFPLSKAWWHLFILTGIERTGKGIRGAPRDAFIGEKYKGKKGKAFGFHRSMDTAGAITGSVIAFILLWMLKLDYRSILFIAAIISFLALPFIYLLKESKVEKMEKVKAGKPIKKFTAIATLFYLGNFTYGFFLWRAKDIFYSFNINGVVVALLLYILFNIVYASLSTYFGKLGDKIGRKILIIFGYILYSFTCIGFAILSFLPEIEAILLIILLFILYGMVYALIESNQRAYTSDLARYQGAAQGIFKASTGIATLPAGIIAGLLWDILPALTFIYGASLAILSSSLMATIHIEKD